MPSEVKNAVISLILSCVFTLIASYFDSYKIAENGAFDPIMLGFNIFWLLLMAWIIWDLYRGKNINLIIIFVGIVVAVSLVWDLSEFGFGLAQFFYCLELSMFIAAYCFLNTEKGKSWQCQVVKGKKIQ